MSSKGGNRHLKKMAAPKSWNVERKDVVWIAKPRAGPHSLKGSMPLTTILTIVLKKADNAKESERLIKSSEVFVDGRVVKDPKFAVGFMDVLSFPRTKEQYIVIYDNHGRLKLQELEKPQSYKLCRIEKKTVVKGNKKQIGLHDGRTQLVDKEYKTGDVVKLSIPEQKIIEHLEFKKGMLAYVMGGQHAGKIAKIKGEIPGTATREALVVMEKEGEAFNAPRRYLFIIGKDKPEITIV